MDVMVRLGAGLAPVGGVSRLRTVLPENATVDLLVSRLRDLEPSLASGLESALPVVGGVHVLPTYRLADGDEVALLIPVAGG